MEAKDDFGHWALDFILQSLPDTEINGNMIKNVLRITPLSDLDSRLKKTFLLRTLQNHLFTHSITEPLLKTLELLEELFRCDVSPVTAAMSAAYCAVAVECTVKYLQVNSHRHNPPYLRAVNRIWRVRIPHMNSSGSREGSLLLSVELERWRKDIETSLLDSQVRERLASIDTRSDAIIKLRAFLDEAWADLGPPFLLLAASVHAQVNQEREIQKCSSAAAENLHLPTTIEVEKTGDCISGELLAKNSLPTTIEVEKVGHCISGTLQTLAKDSLPTTIDVEKDGDCISGELQKLAKDSLQTTVEVEKVGDCISGELLAKDSLPTTIEVEKDGDCISGKLQRLAKNSLPPTVEVEKVGDCISGELLAKDFLPTTIEVEKVAHCISRTLETLAKDSLPTTIEVEKDGDCISGKLQRLTKNSLPPTVEVEKVGDCISGELQASAKDPLPPTIQANEDQTSIPQNCDQRPSLMEKNSTARVYEWDESIDGLEDGTSNRASRFNLPTPKRRKLSPLKKYEPTAITTRRKSRRWNQLEEETLRTGVIKFGRGNWKLILNSHEDIFEGRTEVDLKDKWRNMTRHGYK